MVHLKSNLIVAASALLSLSSAAPTSSGDFDVVTMNVAGLPAILNGNGVPGDKTTNSKAIGSYLAQYKYDIVNMQEDFNFHAAIYETDDHPYRTATSGGVVFGSGLNTVSNFPWTGFSRTTWATCSSGSGDCLTPKGFTFMKVRVSEGVHIDTYNLHADAGTEPGDITARIANLKQVADFINVWSVGNAVLVFGDTNARYTRQDGITVFGAQNGLTDAWVQLVRGGVNPTVGTLCTNPSTTVDCEVVDKLFYRGSKVLDLQATEFSYDSNKFLQPDGNILSDHNILRVNYTWSLGSKLRQSDFMGGPHGDWFNDLPSIPDSPKLASITLRGGSRIDAVSVTLRSGQTFKHGGSGGSDSTLTLAAGEVWTKATYCQDTYSGNTRIFYIQATTSTGRTVTKGSKSGSCADVSAEPGWGIVGYLGRNGDEVDQLAFVFALQ